MIPLLCILSYLSHTQKSRITFGIVTYTAMIILGMIRFDLFFESTSNQVPQSIISEKIKYKATIAENTDFGLEQEWLSIDIIIDSILINNQWIDQSIPVIAIIQIDSLITEFQYGDNIIFDGTLEPISENRNPHTFNYQRYLFLNGITHQVYLPSQEWTLLKTRKVSIQSIAKRIQSILTDVLRKYIPDPDNQGIAVAMILGNKNYISSDVLTAYQETGSAHIIAVSGLHVGIVSYIILLILTPFSFRSVISRAFKATIIISCLIAYALITGMSISVIRATVMYSSLIFIYLFSSQRNIWNTLAGAAFLILLYQPQQLFHIGFQFSFLAIIGILFFNPYLNRFIKTENTILRYFLNLFTVSVSAQSLLWPLIIYYFNIFSFGFLVSNILIIPAAFFIILCGILLLIFHTISATFSYIIAHILNGILTCINHFVFYIQQIDPISYDKIWMSSIAVVLCYGMMWSLAQLLYRPASRYLFSFLFSFNLLLSLIAVNTYHINHSGSLVIYDHKKEFIIDLIHDRTCYSIVSAPLNDLTFISERNRIRHGIRNIIHLDINKDYIDQHIKKWGHHVEFHEYVLDIEALLNTDKTTFKKILINDQKTNPQKDEWIIGLRESKKEQTDINSYHDISEQGPLIINFKYSKTMPWIANLFIQM